MKEGNTEGSQKSMGKQACRNRRKEDFTGDEDFAKIVCHSFHRIAQFTKVSSAEGTIRGAK